MRFISEFNYSDLTPEERANRQKIQMLGSAAGTFVGSQIGEQVAKSQGKKTVSDQRDYRRAGAAIGGILGYMGTGKGIDAYNQYQRNKNKPEPNKNPIVRDAAIVGATGATLGGGALLLKKLGKI